MFTYGSTRIHVHARTHAHRHERTRRMHSMRGWALLYARKLARVSRFPPRLQATHLGLSEIDEPSLRGCSNGLLLLAASHNELRTLPDAIGTVPTPPSPHPLPPPAFGASRACLRCIGTRRFVDGERRIVACRVGRLSLYIALHAAWLHRLPSASIARSRQLTRLEALLLDHNRLEALPAQIGALALLREVGARPSPVASTSAALEYCAVPLSYSTVRSGPSGRPERLPRPVASTSASQSTLECALDHSTPSTALVLVVAVRALQSAFRST